MQYFIDAPTSTIDAISKYMDGFLDTPFAILSIPRLNKVELFANIMLETKKAPQVPKYPFA